MKKKLLSLLLALTMLLPCLPVTASAAEEANKWAGDDGILKVLCIGTSYTRDCLYYFDQVEQAQDPNDDFKLVMGYLYQGGVMIETHADNAVNNVPAYIYYKYDRTVSDKFTETPNATTVMGVQDEDWDLISIQISSTGSNQDDSALDRLLEVVKANTTNPKVKIGRHMIWSLGECYQFTGSGTTHEDFIRDFNSSPLAHYNFFSAFVKNIVSSHKDLEFIVPIGTAMQNLREGIVGDNIQRDFYHANPFGRTMASYTWYAFLTGKPLDSINLSKTSWAPSDYEKAAYMEAINNALANPYEVTQPTITKPDPRPIYYTLEERSKEGGEVKAYDVNHPTEIVTVKYTGTKNTARANTFCRLNDDGVLDAQLVFNWIPTVGYHNYFHSYDAEKNTMMLADGTASMGGHTGAASCGITCTPSTKSGGRELPYYVLRIPTTTPVIDVSGEDHGLKTLQDIIDLSATHRIRMNHYSYDATAPKVLFVDEVKLLETSAYELKDSDVVFIPGTASVGAACEAYIMKSATAAVGDKVSVTIPSNAPKATGNKGNTTGRFWQMMGEELKIINGMWYSHNKQGDPALTSNQYGYHDKLVNYGDTYVMLEQHPDHLGGGKKCTWAFNQACGTNDSRGRECAGKLTTNGALKIIDLRADVLAGKEAPVNTVYNVMKLCEANKAVVNTYVPDGTKEAGTAAAIIVIDNSGYLTRGEVVQALYEKAGKPAVTPKVTFTDVPADSTYYNAVSWAANKKYISGYGDGSFGLNDKITMEQLSVILWNYMGHPADDVGLDAIGPHSAWALRSLHWSIAQKIFINIPYDEVGDLAPRVQTVKMLADYLK